MLLCRAVCAGDLPSNVANAKSEFLNATGHVMPRGANKVKSDASSSSGAGSYIAEIAMVRLLFEWSHCDCFPRLARSSASRMVRTWVRCAVRRHALCVRVPDDGWWLDLEDGVH